MPRRNVPKQPSWADVSKKIEKFSSDELRSLIQDLYRLSYDNQGFFHTRLFPEQDHLSSYKKVIQSAIHPYLEDHEDLEIEKANEAVKRYALAANDPLGSAELMTHYVECANNFTLTYGDIGEEFYDAVLDIYENAIETVLELPGAQQREFQARLEKVKNAAAGMGWGYYDGLSGLYDEGFGDG